ncbi:MAG: hypothetical protein WBR29_05350 [Gammaproteobacteria bacterium]
MCHAEIKHTLISTTIKTTAIVIAVLFLVSQSVGAQSTGALTSPASQRALVVQLGMPGNKNLEDVKKLSRTPYTSVGLLISQLHTVAHPEMAITGYGSTDFNHLVWVIAALRYMTGGMDFCAPTRWKFASSGEDARRSYWLHFANKNCVTFFAVWPSRDRYYIAPLDAQYEIIDAWHRWFAEKGKVFTYKPLTNPDPGQWLEGVEKPIPIGRTQ